MFKALTKIGLGLLVLVSVGNAIVSCKEKTKADETKTEEKTPVPPEEQVPMTTQPEPVTIAVDDSLAKGIATATKDYPTVMAEVKNGEIILTGTIERSRLPKLMQGLTLLKPKKITNQLQVQ